MKQTRNKITSHLTDCLECGKHFEVKLLQSIMEKQGKFEIPLKCFCGARHRLVENVNGWLVLRKYVKKKDRVKRINNGK